MVVSLGRVVRKYVFKLFHLIKKKEEKIVPNQSELENKNIKMLSPGEN